MAREVKPTPLAPDRDGRPSSPVFADPSRHLPRVGRRRPAWRFVLACAGLAGVGAVMFMNLSQGRLQAARAQEPPGPDAVQPARAPKRAAAAAPAPQPAAPATQPARPAPAPLEAGQFGGPAVVLDVGDAPPAEPAPDAAAKPGAAPSQGADPKASPEERFLQRATTSSVETARATRLRDTALIAPQGTVIPAVLETALDSDLPGFARAVVSRDVRGYDETTVLIPKGSKLIGQYKSAVSSGQSRAFVIWTRLLTPDGVSVDLASPGGDELGRGGLAGETNAHFLRRFGSSILMSVVTAGLTAAAEGRNNSTAIVIGSPAGVTGAATQAFSRDADIPDTINVKQGAAIRVFVARDLDFSTVIAARRPE